MHASELRELRLQVGLTQDELAKELGVTRVFVGLMERGLKPISDRTAAAARSIRKKPLNRMPQEADPQRRLVEKSLIQAGAPFEIDPDIDGARPDFFLTNQKLAIYIAREREDSRNAMHSAIPNKVILQGKIAVVLFSTLLQQSGLAIIENADEALYAF